MRRHPCPTPQLCGVSFHLSPNNCKGYRTGKAFASLPEPVALAGMSDLERRERDEFEANGGVIQQEWNPDGSLSAETWKMNGRTHREDGPADIEYDRDGEVLSERWYLNGKLSRSDGPAALLYTDGKVVREEWWVKGKLSREGGPARQEWSDEGQILSESWMVNGRRHRVGGYAYREWDFDGRLKLEEWFEDGQGHREGGPAKIRWVHGDDPDDPSFQEWLVRGELHREDGPAMVQKGYDDRWYLEDTQYTEDEYYSAVAPYYRKSHPEFADMPDEWVAEYLKGQGS